MTPATALRNAEEAEVRANTAPSEGDKASWRRMRDRWLEKAIALAAESSEKEER